MKGTILLTIISLGIMNSVFSQAKIDKVVIYNSFWRGGTTAMINGAFNNPQQCGVDTTNIANNNVINSMISNIINNSRIKRLYQQKFSGIDYAGEIYLDGSRHFILICFPNIIYDITSKKKYKADEKQLLELKEILMQ